MNLSPVVIAIQGVANGPLLMAVQGLLPVALSITPAPDIPIIQLGSHLAGLGGSLAPKSIANTRRRTSGAWLQIAGEDWFERWLAKVKKASPLPFAIETAASRQLMEEVSKPTRLRRARVQELILFA